MIVVSHRGPYRFEANGDGSFASERGARRCRERARRGAREERAATRRGSRPRSPTTIGPAAESGSLDDLDIDLRLVALDPELHTMHYDVVSNGVLWFLFHDLFDRMRRPRFDQRFREAWDAYRTVNDAFAEATADAAAPGDVVLVNDYQLSLVGAPDCASSGPTCASCTSRTRRSAGPTTCACCPTYAAEDLCGALARNPAGFHTARWARAYHQSARDVLGRRAPIAPTFAASLGPDVAALDAVAAGAEAHAAAQRARRRGRRSARDRAQRSHRAVEEHRARLPRLRPAARSPARASAAGSCSSRCCTRRARRLPEYLAYTNEIEQVVARVNDRWATRDWTPILLDERDDFPRSIAAMQRYDVLLVNPIKDGLNLVAKEGPAVNRRDGLLCLSREAGAYDELAAAPRSRCTRTTSRTRPARSTARSRRRSTNAPTIAAKLRELATARTPADWVADLVAHAS